jgi:hypothetical protein
MGLRREQAARTLSIAGCALGGLASLVGGLSGRLGYAASSPQCSALGFAKLMQEPGVDKIETFRCWAASHDHSGETDEKPLSVSPNMKNRAAAHSISGEFLCTDAPNVRCWPDDGDR